MTQVNEIITDENDSLYAETAIWCNENDAYLEEIEPEGDVRRFQVKAIPEPTLEEKNEQIRQQRQARYVAEADPLRLDWDESSARGEEQAEEKKQLWLAKKDEIRTDLPYIKID